ncbi:hypothetical protein Goari_011673 [Gossypium aridum]|uniref:RING-type E3 ubiquitin transferase n=1 Tax=Gossypium aridum TaxID=34290 RepID=A0A7J8WYA4_GOSAI|nr:hypothetical protein [Gossypium aridum]
MSSTSTSTCRWRPYSNSNGLEANAAIGLVILFCALICSLALNAAIRCFLRGGGHSRNNQLPLTQQQLEQRKPVPETAAARMVEASTLVYSTGMKLVGAEPECAICLTGFVEGERIQVLGKCKHGFHVQCIQQWLSFHFSCPTCLLLVFLHLHLHRRKKLSTNALTTFPNQWRPRGERCSFGCSSS